MVGREESDTVAVWAEPGGGSDTAAAWAEPEPLAHFLDGRTGSPWALREASASAALWEGATPDRRAG